MTHISPSKYTEFVNQLASNYRNAKVEIHSGIPEVYFEARVRGEVACTGTITLRLINGKATPTGVIGRSCALTGDLKSAHYFSIAQHSMICDMTLLLASLEQFTVAI